LGETSIAIGTLTEGHVERTKGVVSVGVDLEVPSMDGGVTSDLEGKKIPL